MPFSPIVKRGLHVCGDDSHLVSWTLLPSKAHPAHKAHPSFTNRKYYYLLSTPACLRHILSRYPSSAPFATIENTYTFGPGKALYVYSFYVASKMSELGQVKTPSHMHTVSICYTFVFCLSDHYDSSVD